MYSGSRAAFAVPTQPAKISQIGRFGLQALAEISNFPTSGPLLI